MQSAGTHSMPKLLWDKMLKAESSVVVVFLVVQMRLPVLCRKGLPQWGRGLSGQRPQRERGQWAGLGERSLLPWAGPSMWDARSLGCGWGLRHQDGRGLQPRVGLWLGRCRGLQGKKGRLWARSHRDYLSRGLLKR